MNIALGTAQFGSPYGISNFANCVVDEDEIRRIIRVCANNIDTIDTATSYGRSEILLGCANVRDFKLITKIPDVPINICNINGWIREQIHESLMRLKVPKLEAVLFHRPMQICEDKFLGRIIIDSVERLKQEGLVNKIGVSIYSPNELNHLFKDFKFDLVQAPFNVLDRRLYVSGWLKKLHDMKVEVHVRSVFMQGLLLLKSDKLPNYFFRWNDIFSKWQEWLDVYSLTPIEACLSFIKNFSGIQSAVIGVQSAQELVEILNVNKRDLKLKFPDFDVDDEFLLNPSLWPK